VHAVVLVPRRRHALGSWLSTPLVRCQSTGGPHFEFDACHRSELAAMGVAVTVLLS